MASDQGRHFDPLHQLVKTRYGSEAGHYRDICICKLAGQVGHRCGACYIDLHEACADYFKETISFFAHPWHTLKLSRIPSDLIYVCDLCVDLCLPGSFVYRCIQCQFDVHPLCTMLPETIRSPLHPEHGFRMVPAFGKCSACEQSLPVWHYVCPCGKRLHADCVSGARTTSAATDDAAALVTTQTSSSCSTTVTRPRRRTKVAKFLLKTSFRIAVHAATGGMGSPVLEVLAAVLS